MLRHLGVVAALSMMVASCAAAPERTRHDLGAFWIDAPASWSLTSGGMDSAAGHFTGERLRLDYDFGLYSDPLRLPQGATDVGERSVTIDGLPGRQVRYTLQRGADEPMHYLGVHVPAVRATSMGRLKLTVLAVSADVEQIRQAEAVMATIRFKPVTPP